MIIPTQEALTQLIINKFREIGFDKTLGSLNLEELDNISQEIRGFIAAHQQEDEPPF